MSDPMGLDDPIANLKTALSSTLTSGEFSDLTITYQGKKFNVHKIIVCTQSPVLHNACKEDGFKQGNETSVIDLPEDDLFLVEAMLEFMYTFSYRKLSNNDRNAMLFHTKLFALADKYGISCLKQLTTSRFIQDSARAPKDNLIAAIEVTYRAILGSNYTHARL